MGVSVHIEGRREPTLEYRKKLAAYRACDDAGVSPPEELARFFEWEFPQNPTLDEGQAVSLSEAVDGSVEYGDGALIDLSKLPDGVTKIRVWMS